MWRTGANEATMFVVSDDVLINGQKLAAGSYSLHTIPTKDEWTIVFNGTANQWGSFNYDPAKDTLRVKAKPQWLNESEEWLTYSVRSGWRRFRAGEHSLGKDQRAVHDQGSGRRCNNSRRRLKTTVANAKADDWHTPMQAGNYLLNNNEHC